MWSDLVKYSKCTNCPSGGVGEAMLPTNCGQNPFTPSFGAPPPHLAGRDEILQSIREAMATGPSGFRQGQVGRRCLLSPVSDLTEWISLFV